MSPWKNGAHVALLNGGEGGSAAVLYSVLHSAVLFGRAALYWCTGHWQFNFALVAGYSWESQLFKFWNIVSHMLDLSTKHFFQNKTCILCLKLYNKDMSQHSLLLTAQVDFRGKLIGKECMGCKVDMKYGLIVFMSSWNLDYNAIIG